MSDELVTTPQLKGEADTVEGRLADMLETSDKVLIDGYRVSFGDEGRIIKALLAAVPMAKCKFKLGEKVNKVRGYKFPGTVVAVFATTKGDIRIVVEMDGYGLLHIYNEEQLVHTSVIENAMVAAAALPVEDTDVSFG
nr:Unknown Function [uncultured bacterium]